MLFSLGHNSFSFSQKAVQRNRGARDRHRGPDDSGAWVDENAGIALGFQRLAILDLSNAAHQPMLSRNGRFTVVFNGEIYNHLEMRTELEETDARREWIGHSDTETLLASFDEWGVRRTLERTVGMFAVALWDRQERRLHLARDRFGEKPLYYGWTRTAFVFGSELQALRRGPAFENQVDPDVLSLYMQFCCVPAPFSIYRNVYKLEPGCVLSLSLEAAATAPAGPVAAPLRHAGLTLEHYWSLVDVAKNGLAEPIEEEEEATAAWRTHSRMRCDYSLLPMFRSVRFSPVGLIRR